MTKPEANHSNDLCKVGRTKRSDNMIVNGYRIEPCANLRGADLCEANLHGANLQGANLQGADLREANLLWANLSRADLRGADLRRANLQGADLQGADLRGASLQGADLQGADLQEANLRGANLRGANLQEADLDFSCWPLWCGTKGVKLDAAQVDQLCLHLYWVVAPRSKLAEAVKARAKRAARKRNVDL